MPCVRLLRLTSLMVLSYSLQATFDIDRVVIQEAHHASIALQLMGKYTIASAHATHLWSSAEGRESLPVQPLRRGSRL